MQTFLPYADFAQSAAVLDYRRLGKQRVECFQILKALRGEGTGWVNHPATLMWRGHDAALENYMGACIDEWVRRGYRNTMSAKLSPGAAPPRWFGDERFHSSHRANLLRKDPVHYGQFNWSEDPGTPYYWPEEAQRA